MTDNRKEIYASAEESKAVMRSIPITPFHIEVLRLIEERGLNEQGVTNAQYVQGIIDICAALVADVASEREACAQLCEQSDRYRGSYFAKKIRAKGKSHDNTET